MCFADGTRYTGQWRNGKPAKEGTFYFPNGERHFGRWKSSSFEPIKKNHVDVDTIWSGSSSANLILSPGGSSTLLATVDEDEKVPSSNASAMSSTST